METPDAKNQHIPVIYTSYVKGLENAGEKRYSNLILLSVFSHGATVERNGPNRFCRAEEADI